MNRRSIVIVVEVKNNSGSDPKQCAVVVQINSIHSKDLFKAPATLPNILKIHTDKCVDSPARTATSVFDFNHVVKWMLVFEEGFFIGIYFLMEKMHVSQHYFLITK